MKEQSKEESSESNELQHKKNIKTAQSVSSADGDEQKVEKGSE